MHVLIVRSVANDRFYAVNLRLIYYQHSSVDGHVAGHAVQCGGAKK